MGYSRDKLEENRKKKKLLEQVFQQNPIQQTAQKLNDAAQSIKPKTNTTKTTAAKSSGSAAKTNTVTQSTQKQQTGLSSLKALNNVAKTVQSVGQKVVQNANDMRNLQRNSIMWHGTTDAETRQSLNQQNNAIRQRLGLSFDPSTGVTFDSKTGKNYSLPTQMLYGNSAGQKARMTSEYAQSREFMGKDAKDIVVQPTYEQILTYGADTARGVNAHQVMADLYSRAAETWSDDDTRNRDNAREALADEMQNIMRQYGLQYSARSTGPNARFAVSDNDAIEKLRAAGADETTLAYVAENIQMREAADRLGQGIEAVAKRAVGSIPALVETSDQRRENLEQSRENPEYVKLEQEQQRLNAQLQEMQKKGQDVSSVVEYMKVYNELQEVTKQKDALAVKTPVDQNKWGQTMLREAAEAQANATAGLADVPRFLANTGISIAGNAPTMALSAIPGAGPVAGMALMGASAAGQRAAELNAQGVSPSEALGRGLTSGIIEAVTEKLPLDEMAKLLKGGGTSAVRNILRQMGIEASEETASYLMNYAADLAANDPNAKFSFAELAQSALGGMVSGGFFGTEGTVIGGTRTRQGPTVGIPESVSTQEADAGARMAQEAMQTAQGETLLPRTEIIQEGSSPLGIESNPYMGMPVAMLQNRLGQLQARYWDADTETQQAMLEDMSRLSEAIDSGEQQVINSQTLGRRLAELDAEKRQAETLLPGPIRDRAIAQVEDKIKNVLQTGRTIEDRTAAAQARNRELRFTKWPEGEKKPSLVNEREERPQSTYRTLQEEELLQEELASHFIEEQPIDTGGIYDKETVRAAKERQKELGTEQEIPVDAAFQYGLSPEAAMLEARERARNEALEEKKRMEQADVFNKITNGKSQNIVSAVSEAMNFAKRVAARHRIQRATVRATPSSADRYVDADAENAAVELVNNLEGERFFLRNLRNAWRLTDAELVNAREIAAGRGPVTQMNEHRFELVETYARALRNYQNDMEPAYTFYRELKDARMERAFEMIADSDAWKDAKFGLSLKVRTPERVIRKVMGDTKAAKQLYDAYFAPVIQHDAESVRWENQMRQRLKEIAKGLSHEDSVYIHLRNRAELAPDNKTLQMMLEDYVEKNRDKIHFKEANEAMERMIELTNEMHPQINEAWVRNGVEPLEWHKRYLPSLTPTKEGKWYNRILRKFGIETMMDELPDDIAGRTENRRPGHQYASFANERSGVNLEFDAVKALDNYISNAAAAIFHTDDIQNLRVLEEAIRYKYSDEGSKAEMKAIGQMPQLTIEERVQRMSELWLKNAGQFPHFPSWIAEYTNLLAGKKARGDRQMESDLNRGMFRAMTDLESKVAANMTGANISTALSNIIPLTQGAGELHYSSMARATIDYAYDLIHKDREFRDTSDFLTNRSGTERVVKTTVQRASDAASVLTRAIDHMTSEVLTRARYIDNTKRGMSQKDALKEADRWTAELMGDRSKGARPVLFEERNPISRAFSMFQLEVMNQYDYLFGDIPSHARAQGKGKVAVAASTAGALIQIFLLAHLYNDAREKATGTRGAFDPIEIANDFVGRVTGFALPNVFTLIEEAAQGDLTLDDFRVEKSESAWENAQATMQDVASNVPFLSGPIGALFGASNARLPIESVVPDFSSIFSKTGVAQREAAIKELTKPIYGVMMPFGGTQIKKTVEGIATELAGGSYVHDNDGNLKLQFPAYGESPLEWARSAIFGKWSGEEAQKYIDSGFKGLSADETRVYNGLRDNLGVEPSKAMEAILSLRGFESKEDETGKTIQTVKEQQRRALFDNAVLSPEQKQWIDKELLVDPDSDQEPADYSNYTNFVLSMYDSENRKEAAEEAVQHGLTVDQFVQWDDRLSEVAGMKDRFDKNQYTAAEARGIVLDEVMKDSALSDSEKQAIADYVLISSMDSDTQKELWETVAKGKVNASDFLRFKSDISTYEEGAKGTGTDNMANVATILRGYDGLTDEQRDILFQTYNETMSNNPFHVSTYEKAIADNSLYQSLTDEGKAALRALTNEYEQYINEGRELDEWRAKAYMAEKEAGIAPGIYALYRTVLETVNAQNDGNTNRSQQEVETAINTIPGLTQYQKAYIWQSANKEWKKNPFGSATVTEYQSGMETAINPVANGTQTSSFGPREQPTAGASTWHDGLDIGASEGEPIKAILSGKVIAKDHDSGSGYYIKIDHGNGRVSTYMHMKAGSTDNINVGDEVSQGQQIGAVGSTGISTGPHLDIRITQDGKYVDPLTVIPGYGIGPSGYVSGNTAAASTISSGVAAAQNSKSRSSSTSSGFKDFDPFEAFEGLGF